jgi:hypothetical protein
MKMKRTLVFATLMTAISGFVLPPPIHADSVSVGINIGAPPPPPPYVVQGPPQLVVVPGTPVYYAPSLSFNFFAYSGRYYTYYNGGWFMTANFGTPWNYVAVQRVPRPVRGVPVTYYKVPPGHGHHGGGPPPWAGHGKGHHHEGHHHG